MENQQPLGLLEIDYGDLEFYEKCGGGAYGSVYRARWKSRDTIVAVKKVLVLEKEAHVLSILSHKNIIQFYGAVTKPPNYCLVTEYAENGNLYSYLASHQGEKMLGFDRILQWALDIAHGINYLHNEAPEKILHRDLKSKNVVLNTNYVCKLCDFGASRFHGSTTKMSLAGTIPWMAPEVLQSLPTSEASDIWSYGVVLWELLTHEVPFKGIEGFQIVWLVVENDERLVIPSTCPPALADLMKMTWRKDPRERPTCRQIIDRLRNLQRDDRVCASYLRDRSLWKAEIQSLMERMNTKERHLDLKHKELEEWEQELKEREQGLDRQQQYLKKLNSHDVNTWNEDDVYLWLKQLVTEDHTKDLVRYVDLFKKHNISGRSLLLLTQEDLQTMGVASIGHLKSLHDEIVQLSLNNKRMLEFPPLENTKVETTCVLADTPATRVKLVLIFGSHIRRGANEAEHKWKMYVEIDENDNPAAKGCVKKVSFRYQETEQIVQHAPFVMEQWYTGISDDTIVDCTVSYNSLVKKPKQSRYRHKIRLDGSKVHQREVTLWLKPNVISQKSPIIQRPMTPNKNISSPSINLMGPWQGRAIISNSPSPRSSPSANSVWARVVAGRRSSASGSPASSRKSSLQTLSVIPADPTSKIQRTTSAPMNSPSTSRKNSREKKGRKISPTTNKSTHGRAGYLLKKLGFRTKHRRGSKVKWQQQQLNGHDSSDITVNTNAAPSDIQNSSSESTNTASDVSVDADNVTRAVNGNGNATTFLRVPKTPPRVKRLSTNDSGCQMSPESMQFERSPPIQQHRSRWNEHQSDLKKDATCSFEYPSTAPVHRKNTLADLAVVPTINKNMNDVCVDLNDAMNKLAISTSPEEGRMTTKVVSDNRRPKKNCFLGDNCERKEPRGRGFRGIGGFHRKLNNSTAQSKKF